MVEHTHTDSPPTDPTRERLLDEAERLFAEKGFNTVTVREITKAADCNLASVNYHFGGKHNLYLEVFRSRWIPRSLHLRNGLKELLANDSISLKDSVRTIARYFPYTIDNEVRLRHKQLMIRELMQPGEALQLVLREVILPSMNQITDILAKSAPWPVDRRDLFLVAFSIFGLGLYFETAKPIVAVLTGVDTSDEAKYMEQIVEHIATMVRVLHNQEQFFRFLLTVYSVEKCVLSVPGGPKIKDQMRHFLVFRPRSLAFCPVWGLTP